MRFFYEPAIATSYGYFRCPKCAQSFVVGSPAIHRTDCSEEGYEAVDYYFGPKELARLKAGEAPGLAPRGLQPAFQAGQCFGVPAD